jgi:hypothetical protein
LLLLLRLLPRLRRLLPLVLLLLLLRLRQAGCRRLDAPHIDLYPSIFDEQFDDPVLEHLEHEVRTWGQYYKHPAAGLKA